MKDLPQMLKNFQILEKSRSKRAKNEKQGKKD